MFTSRSWMEGEESQEGEIITQERGKREDSGEVESRRKVPLQYEAWRIRYSWRAYFGKKKVKEPWSQKEKGGKSQNLGSRLRKKNRESEGGWLANVGLGEKPVSPVLAGRGNENAFAKRSPFCATKENEEVRTGESCNFPTAGVALKQVWGREGN